MITKKPDWNPDLYLKYNRERLQPSIDLVSRITVDRPDTIIDIGCGPGNSTQILVQRWPEARIVGIDNSPSMIEKAKKDYPRQEWMLCDAGKDEIPGKFDIVFSNATIQWIPDHENVLKKFYNLLNENGLIAVQIPMFWDMPIGKSIAGIAESHRWSLSTKGVKELFTIHNYHFYYDHLSVLFKMVDIWETHYMHSMESHTSILEMIRSTGMKPFLERLEDEKDREDFEELVLKKIISDYPLQADGKVIFPFKRLFFVAKK
jgi:trans-aconitate 2-methyltransferase